MHQQYNLLIRHRFHLLTHYTLQTQIVLSLIAVLYVLAAMIRLAYFNVMEEEDQNRDETGAKIYTGLPVTSSYWRYQSGSHQRNA